MVLESHLNGKAYSPDTALMVSLTLILLLYFLGITVILYLEIVKYRKINDKNFVLPAGFVVALVMAFVFYPGIDPIRLMNFVFYMFLYFFTLIIVMNLEIYKYKKMAQCNNANNAQG